MQVILSRKGFDSATGGCPSPIFHDDSMISLPIPDNTNCVRFGELWWRRRNLGEVVERLSSGRYGRQDSAHLDPDLRHDFLPRLPGWRPLLGQTGAAQAHLRNRGVTAGDVFLFWGLFQRVDRQLRWSGPRLHVIWGWMQIGDVVPVDAEVRGNPLGKWAWVAGHPHLAHHADPYNTLYISAANLDILGVDCGSLPGAGTFDRFTPRLQLTAEGCSASVWSVPRWLVPNGRPALSYHGDESRWTVHGDGCRLRTVGRGQEFILDAATYPDAGPWIVGLLRDSRD